MARTMLKLLSTLVLAGSAFAACTPGTFTVENTAAVDTRASAVFTAPTGCSITLTHVHASVASVSGGAFVSAMNLHAGNCTAPLLQTVYMAAPDNGVDRYDVVANMLGGNPLGGAQIVCMEFNGTAPNIYESVMFQGTYQ